MEGVVSMSDRSSGDLSSIQQFEMVLWDGRREQRVKQGMGAVIYPSDVHTAG